jgi:hypothetical protein
MNKARTLPPRVAYALAKLGADLKDARRRRRMPMAHAAQRVLISRSTLHKVERGDPNVGMGVYAILLESFGMIERLERLLDAPFDRLGLALERNRLPRRARAATPASVSANRANG